MPLFKRFLLAGAILLLVFGGVIGFKLYKRAAVQQFLDARGTPAVHLNATVARAATWEQQLEAIGSLRARQGIEIRSEVDGVIRRVHVESKQPVKAGDLLVELDDTVDRATLKSAQVRLKQTQRDFERDRSLFERKLVSEDKFDSSRSDYESAQALVEEIQGIIDKKRIRAPFTGTIGIHNLAEGHYLDQGDQVVTLQSLDTLYLDLPLPEKELERLRPGQRVIFTVPTHRQRPFNAEVRFVDVVVETTTRNVLVRAEADNPRHDLLPGMFAKATVILEEDRDVVTVPREAVAFSLYGETVYLLEKNEESNGWVARRKAVTTDEVRNGYISVAGISPGQLIAEDTQHRLLDGTPVVIDNLAELEANGAVSEAR